MDLRSLATTLRPASLALAGLAVLAALVPAAALGGRADYPSPLYLSGRAASSLDTSYRLVGSPGPGTPASAPTAAVGGAGAITSGSYTYVYAVIDPTGGESHPSPASTPAASVPFGQTRTITVNGLPTGVDVRLYRKRSTYFYEVAYLPANASSTHVDNVVEVTSLPVLPVSQHRVRSSASGCTTIPCVGYGEFAPGRWAHSSNDSVTVAPPLSPTLGRGWIVDGPGSVHVAAGTWTLEAKVESGGNAGGEAHLVLGLWKVRTAGNAIVDQATILDPNDPAAESSVNLITSSVQTQTITHTVSLPAVSLAADERLLLQLWRRQTVAMTGGTPNRLLTLRAYDGTARIELPAVSTLPDVPAPAAPADAAVVNAPALAATFADPDPGDTGSVEFRVCRDAGCADVAASGMVAAQGGETASWPGDGLAPGSYVWQARAQDALGGRSDWSAPRSFRLNAAPLLPALGGPEDGGVVNAPPALTGSFSDADAGDAGTVDFRVCRDLACADVAASGAAPAPNGGAASWTPALDPGTYVWQARARDEWGGESAWSQARGFRLNGAPAVPQLVKPAAGLVTNTVPRFSASFSDPDAGDRGVIEIRICADAGCTDVRHAVVSERVANGAAPRGLPVAPLAAGTYHWQARALDELGGASPWSAPRTFRLNATPKASSPGVPPAAAQLRRSSATLSARFADPEGDRGRVRFRVCRNASPQGLACRRVVATGLSGRVGSGASARWRTPRLRDGVYHWQVRSEDASGGRSAWSRTRRLVVAAMLVRVTSDRSLRCDAGGSVAVQVRLAAPARLTAALWMRGRRDVVRALGSRDAGTHTVRVALPWSLERRVVYRLELTAQRAGERGTDAVSLRLDSPAPGRAPRPCRAL